MVVAPPLARVALRFGFPEYFALMCSGMVILTFMSGGSMLKSLMVVAVGASLGTVGMDLITGVPRFTFGVQILMDDVGVVPVVMGLFGISEVLLNIDEGVSREVFVKKISHYLPKFKGLGGLHRGDLPGNGDGVLPRHSPRCGDGGFVVHVLRHREEGLQKSREIRHRNDRRGRRPGNCQQRRGRGRLYPSLTLGVPASPALALLLGFLLSYGVQVGPLLIKQHSDVFWGVIASMYVGNIMLLILNLPLIGIWVKVLKIPYVILFPLILLFCVIGAYSLNNNPIEVVIMIVFGVVGYLMKKFDYAAAPMVMAMVLSPLMENSLRQSLLLSHGNFLIFFTRPLSATLMAVAILLLILPVLPWLKARKWEGMKEPES